MHGFCSTKIKIMGLWQYRVPIPLSTLKQFWQSCKQAIGSQTLWKFNAQDHAMEGKPSVEHSEGCPQPAECLKNRTIFSNILQATGSSAVCVAGLPALPDPTSQ